MTIDLALDKTTHDIYVANYDLQLVDKVDQIVQAVKMRLLMIFDEWFLDSREGVRYYDLVCVKNPDMALVDSLFRATIVETKGVNSLMEYSSEYSPSTRKLKITFQINTLYGVANSTLGDL